MHVVDADRREIRVFGKSTRILDGYGSNKIPQPPYRPIPLLLSDLRTLDRIPQHLNRLIVRIPIHRIRIPVLAAMRKRVCRGIMPARFCSEDEVRNKLDYFLCWIWGNLCQIRKIDSERVYVLIGHTSIGLTDSVFHYICESQD